MHSTTNGRPARPNVSTKHASYQYQVCDECFMLTGWPEGHTPPPWCAYCCTGFMRHESTRTSQTLVRGACWGLIALSIALAIAWWVN